MPQKQTLEVVVFILLLLTLGAGIVFHPFFQVRDVAITGVDAESTERVRRAVQGMLDKKFFSVRTDSYMFVRPSRVERTVNDTIVAEHVVVTLAFPHSLRITVQEVPIRFQVVAPQGTAYLSADGVLVRWYDTTSTTSFGYGVTEIHTDARFASHMLRTEILPQRVIQAIAQINSAQTTIDPRGIAYLEYMQQALDRLDVMYKRGFVVNFAIVDSMDAQLKKAALASHTYATAKKIDVRFGDKVFVSL